jgi:hypothetical protein
LLEKRVRFDENTGEEFSTKIYTFPATFDEDKGYLFWTRKSFAKSFLDVPFPSEMSKLDIAHMTLLSKHLWSNTNLLGYRGHGGIKPYGIDDIAQAIELKPRQTYNFIQKMIALGMIARVDVRTEQTKETHYYVNPIYYFSNNRLSLNLYLIFRKQLDEVLPDWVKNKFAMINAQNPASSDKLRHGHRA